MQKVDIKAFRFSDDVIELFEDSEGKDCAISLPRWMFDQMVEKAFNVRVEK